ncbi:MAG: CDP-diacylglycerol--glycerol-3-phosphate 3-phosphatidyltransferase [Fibrobacterota bacterium]|nr:CDP-diacylglycerol--glycerol-3-phosphate 3-phosphatidyltransferase [Fibrobacterota bacterium]
MDDKSAGTATADPAAPESLEPKRIAGRMWVLTKLGTFILTLLCLFLERPLSATVFLSASLIMGFWASFKLEHEDIERPLALFWLELGEKLLGNLIFLVLFLRLLWDQNEPFPTMLCAGLITITLRNIFYLIFSIALLKDHRNLPLKTIWGKGTTLAMNATMMLYVWNSEHWSGIAMVTTILMIIATSIGYLYFYYRDVESRKPVSLATQVTFSRILLAPVFIWVFFYDNNLVYQDNHLTFKILAAVLAIFFVASDGLDGYLARKRGEVSTLGKFLDPYSDKISNMAIFLCFLASGYAAVWMVAVIFFRESTVDTLRTLGAASGVTIDARRSGKWKTALQGVAIISILVLEIVDTLLLRLAPHVAYWPDVWAYIPYSMMGFVTLVTLLSGVDYFVANKKVLKKYF